MKKLTVGILAHVDAGKTTLSEAMLYLGGSIRKLGRVDHKDAFLDTYELERQRGITIFSKQAQLILEKAEITLLDTPGHVDFSAEMERTLQVLDYAILVISATDGVQGHTRTLWKLLEQYQIPVFIFINKMDLDGMEKQKLMDNLLKNLHGNCVDFSLDKTSDEWLETVAMCEEEALEQYLEEGIVENAAVVEMIAARRLFPCYFGSALKLQGVEEFLTGLQEYTGRPVYPEEFGAKVYKVARDSQGKRLTYMKITGGSLKVKMIPFPLEEKVNQIRIYSSEKFKTADEVQAGSICAVTGLSEVLPGMGLGMEAASEAPVLEPILNYQVILPDDCDVHKALGCFRLLMEEDPQLHICWNEALQQIQIQLMGEVQLEIIKSIIYERFGLHVEFGTGNIVYKETIKKPAEGVGHYEPLRHYAEVHLLLEPLPAGSGLVFRMKCSEDMLDRNWQRLVLTHLAEKEHVGVLTGAPLTDMKITLIAGKAHLKHTEGGDFRQATYRAVRHGLLQTESVLLEPYYSFRLEVPVECLGRAMTDIQRLYGSFQEPETGTEVAVLTGKAPVATMQDYLREVISYTRGRGRLTCQVMGYEPCHNPEEVIQEIGYDWEHDVDNPADSVFCSHGAGVVVKWDKVYAQMHLERGWMPETYTTDGEVQVKRQQKKQYEGTWEQDKELEAIFTRTFGPVKRRIISEQPRKKVYGTKEKQPIPERYQKKTEADRESYLLVDGYNIVFAWEDLRELARDNLDAARYKLMDVLSNYQGYTRQHIICVFDAYKVKGNHGTKEKYNNLDVVYTKEAETADMYIEKVTLEIGKKHHVTVATSDNLEQLIITGHGAVKISAVRLLELIEEVNSQMRADYGLTQ